MTSSTKNIFAVILISSFVISLHFGGILVEGSTESPVELIQEELISALEIYKNFSDAVFGTLSDIGENINEPDSEAGADEEGSVASLLGISYILASTSEQVWPLSFPVFDSVMGNLSWNVLDAFDTVLLEMKQTLNLVTVMFVPLTHNSSSNSSSSSSVEFINVDFEEDDATVPIINEKILNSTNRLIQSNYIQDGVLIPSSTQAIFVNTVNTNLTWKTPWTPIGKRTFNKNEQGEMLQFQGEIQMTEKNYAVEFFILFENSTSGIAFRMPKDISTDRSVANVEELKGTNPSNTTIQIPWMNYTVRSKYNLNDDNNSCEFQKEENVLQILDVLTYVFLGPHHFNVVSVSGAQVINVEEFQDELRQQSDLFNKTSTVQEAPSQNSDTQIYTNFNSNDKTDTDENMDDVEFDSSLEVDRDETTPMKDGRHRSVDTTKATKDAERNEKLETTDDNPDIERNGMKIITFNRSFTWMLFDDHQVPIVAGIVTSLKSPEEVLPPNLSLLGMESWKSVPYFQCF